MQERGQPWRPLLLVTVVAAGTATGALAWALPRFGAPLPGRPQLLVIEASCARRLCPAPAPTGGPRRAHGDPGRFGLRGLRLNPVVSRALRRALAAYPELPSFLVHSCPLDAATLVARPAILDAPSARLWLPSRAEVLAGSPLEGFNLSDPKDWSQDQAADVLRFLLLWRFGGALLDNVLLVTGSEDAEGSAGRALAAALLEKATGPQPQGAHTSSATLARALARS